MSHVDMAPVLCVVCPCVAMVCMCECVCVSPECADVQQAPSTVLTELVHMEGYEFGPRKIIYIRSRQDMEREHRDLG